MNPEKTKSTAIFKHEGNFLSLAADWASPRLYCGSSDGSVYSFDPSAEKKEPASQWTKHDNYVSALVCVPREGGTVVVSGGYDRKLIWWNVANGEVVRTVENAHGGWIRDLIATPDGALLISCGDDMQVKFWETDTGKQVQALQGHAERTPQGFVSALYTLAVSADGKFLAAGDRVGEVRIWEIGTSQLGTVQLAQKFEVPVLYTYDPKQRKRSIGGIRSLAFSPDGAQLAVGGIGQIENVDGLAGPATIEVWDWKQPKRMNTLGLDGHKALINALVYQGDCSWLIGGGGGSDNAVLGYWKVPIPAQDENSAENSAEQPAEQAEKSDKKKETPSLAANHKFKFDGHVHRFLVHPNGETLYTAGYKKLEVWDVKG